jgi:hypothetical protein
MTRRGCRTLRISLLRDALIAWAMTVGSWNLVALLQSDFAQETQADTLVQSACEFGHRNGNHVGLILGVN